MQRLWKRAICGVFAWGMVFCLMVGIAPSPMPSVAAAAPTYDESVGLLQVYFLRLNTRQYAGAYRLYGASLPQRQSYSAFVANFGLVSRFDLAILDTTPAGEETVVHVALVARLVNGGNVYYSGYYVIGRENGRFRIVSKNIVSTGNDVLEGDIPFAP